MAASESSSPRAGQAPKVPISLEGERRKAMKLVYAMERDCEHFRERSLMNETDDNTDEWLEFINLAKNRPGGPGKFNSVKEFENDLQKLRGDQGFLGSRVITISQLQRVCDRAKAFDHLFEMSHLRIEDALNHYMAKYCLSYFAEIEEMDIECVRYYENGINEWQEEIRTCLKDAEQCKENIQEYLDLSFLEYVNSYGSVIRSMHSALDAFVSTCDPFRSWVSFDEGYVKQLRIELACLQGKKNRVSEIIRKSSFKINEQKSQELRTSFNNKKLGEKVKGTVSNRRFCRNREFSFVDKIEMTENILHEKRFALEEAQAKLQTRPLHTLVREPSDGMTGAHERLQHEVARLEKKLDSMKRGKRDMRETRYDLQKQYHNLKGVYETSLRKAERQTEHFKDRLDQIKCMNEEQRVYERKIKAIKSIIYIKTHPATVKKIYFEGYANGEKIDYRGPAISPLYDPRDTLREAIDVAAAGVGKDWNKMYQQLPFNPPRNLNRRIKDLELMDMDFKSVHPPAEQMALRSLDKWKSLSNVTSVNALVRTLRSIKKTEVAKKIEKQVLTVVN